MGALEKAYKPDSVPSEWNTQPGMIISLGCGLPRTSSDLPEDLGRASLAAPVKAPSSPYLALLRATLTVPLMSPPTR